MSHNDHAGVDDKRRPVSKQNIKKRAKETQAVLDFVKKHDAAQSK